jgi:tRNA (mo5U34)-methyltransferase
VTVGTSLRDQVARLHWYHPIDLGNGLITRPERHIQRRFARRLRLLQIPQDLSGRSVLDIGAWDGFWSFECERRGAARVLAIDTYAWDRYGMDSFLLAHGALKSKVEYQRLAVEDLSPDTVGQFDVVLFLGVFYHLRSPIDGLDRLRRIVRQLLILETHTLIPAFHSSYPLVSFFPGDGHETGRPHEFTAIPTEECLVQMLLSASFRGIDVKYRPSMRFVKQVKAALSNRPQSGRLIVHAS